MSSQKLRNIFLCTAVLLCMAELTAQSVDTNQVDDEDSNPLLDMAAGFLQNGGGGALGGVLSGLMQGEGGKQIGDMLLGGMQGAKNNAAGDVLSNLGSLFTNSEGNLDPNILGSVISAFADSALGNKKEEVIQPKKAAQQKQVKKATNVKKEEPGMDMEGILNIASAFLGNQQQSQGSNNAMEGLASALPLIMNTLNSFNGAEAQEREHKHADHAWFLPPLVEKMHVYWDHFINSDLGKAVWENAGLSELTKQFTDKEGKMDFEFILKSLENQPFRRKWIKTATNYLAEWAIHVAHPEVQQRYLQSTQFIVNGFLKSQGFPKSIVFQPTQLSESVTSIANYVFKKYLNTPTDVSVYVKPAMQYVQEILKSVQSKGSYLSRVDQAQLSDKLTDTLNLEIIEPVLRVYRAYRFAKKAPYCQTHVLCVINRHDPNEKLGLPGFKAGLTKLSSFVASAALSYQGGHGFWDLYNAIQDDSNCQARYPADCDEFHEEEIKVTTEMYHSEL